MGIVENEDHYRISNVSIVNINSNQIFKTNQRGEFLISANKGDLLRWVKNDYERWDYIVAESSFDQSLTIVLQKAPKEIEEVKLEYKFKGDLAKDLNYLNQINKKEKGLKSEIDNYIVSSNANTIYRDARDFKQNPLPKYQEGSADFLKIAGLLINKIINKPQYKSTTASKNQFLKTLKSQINKEYYYSFGMSDYDIDRFLAFADRRYNLEVSFKGQVSLSKIEPLLKSALPEFNL